MSDTALQAVVLVLAVTLPISALAARRVPARLVVRYAGAWMVIVAILYGIVAQFT